MHVATLYDVILELVPESEREQSSWESLRKKLNCTEASLQAFVASFSREEHLPSTTYYHLPPTTIERKIHVSKRKANLQSNLQSKSHRSDLSHES